MASFLPARKHAFALQRLVVGLREVESLSIPQCNTFIHYDIRVGGASTSSESSSDAEDSERETELMFSKAVTDMHDAMPMGWWTNADWSCQVERIMDASRALSQRGVWRCVSKLSMSHSSSDSSQRESDGACDRSPAWSAGAALHEQGRCSPCAFYWKSKGCDMGQDCTHCHLCDDKVVVRKKREQTRARKQALKAAARGVPR